MKKILLGTTITLALLLSGCGESAEDKAKVEMKEKILAIEIVKDDFKKQAEDITKEYEAKYGMNANVWLEELKRTPDWSARVKKSYDTTKGKMGNW
jgi:outer membrane lipoprotein-sorting protein